MKNPRWKQTNAIDQLIAIRGSMEGNLSSLEDGIIGYEELVERLTSQFKEIDELIPYLRGKEWNK